MRDRGDGFGTRGKVYIIDLAQIPDIYRCICSNRDQLGLHMYEYMRRFRFSLGQLEPP